MKYFNWLGIFCAMSIVCLAVVASLAAAETVDSRDPDIPIILQYACDNSIISFGDVDTCWPGQTLRVPVIISNADSVDGMYLHAVWSNGLTFDTLDFSDSPWEGTYSCESTSQDIEIVLTEATDTLPPCETPRRIFDMVFVLSPSSPFNNTETVRFGEEELLHLIPANLCYMDTTEEGAHSTITTPRDSVLVILESPDANSYQASDLNDTYKTAKPLKVKVKLYTNFPCSTYSIWFRMPDSAKYVGFDSIGYGANIVRWLNPPDTNDYRIYRGGEAGNTTGGTVMYLGDLKLRIGNYRSSYMSDSIFQDSMFIAFLSGLGHFPYSYVFCSQASTYVPYSDMDTDLDPIRLPQYKVYLSVPRTIVTSSSVLVPIRVNPTFYMADYNLWLNYNANLLTYQRVDSGGVTMPHVTETTQGTGVYKFESSPTTQNNRYAESNVNQTLFDITFNTTSSFEGGDSTLISFNTDPDYNPRVYDWFSEDDNFPNNKIERRRGHGQSIFNTTNGYVVKPVEFEMNAGMDEAVKNVYKSQIDITAINFTGETKSILEIIMTPGIDSVTKGSFAMDSIRFTYQAGSKIHLYPKGTISTTGTLCNIWFHSTGSGNLILSNLSGSLVDTTSGIRDDMYYRVILHPDTAAYYHGMPKSDLVDQLPFVASLRQNYPNPFNGRTLISYSLGEDAFVQLEVIDILGRKVNTLVCGLRQAGEYQAEWNGTNAAGEPVAAGVYFYSLKTENFLEVKKMTYLK